MPVQETGPAGGLAPVGGLPGTPQQSFQTRMNIKFAKRSLVVDLILLATNVMFNLRMLRVAPPGGQAWCLMSLGVHLVDFLWAHSCSKPWPLPSDSYLCWRGLEVLHGIIRWCDLGNTGVCAAMHDRIVSTQHPPPMPGGLVSLAASLVWFLFFSGTFNLAVHLFYWRHHASFSAVAQAHMVSLMPRYFRGWCTGDGPLAHPSLQRDAHRIFHAVRHLLLGSSLPFWWPPGTPELGAAEEVEVLLVWLLVSLGLFVPVLVEMWSATCLFQEHQQQRRQAGLPPERGPHALLYGAFSLFLRSLAEDAPTTAEGGERGGSGGGPAGGSGGGSGDSDGRAMVALGVGSYLSLVAAWDLSIWLVSRTSAG